VLRVGVTGGIGAGKSTVARRLAARGAVLIDADALAREVLAPGTTGLAEVREAFGNGVLGPDGGLDRAALGALVFADGDARARLNGITHPRIAALTAERVAAAPDDAVVVHDVPLLVENAMGDRYHLVVVVEASVDIRLERLVGRRGMSAQAARARIAAQADDGQRRAAADVVLRNDGDVESVRGATDGLWDGRVTGFERNLRQGQPAPRLDTPVRTDPTWPAQAARLAARVARAAGEHLVRVEHVGATSVRGRAAPDVLELRLEVSPGAAGEVAPRLASAGFPPVPPGWPASPAPGEAGARHACADPGRAADLLVVEQSARAE